MRETLNEKRERNRQQRLRAIKHWVEYIKSEPPETWGPQQNAVVDDQLEAADHAGTTAALQQHVKAVAADIATLKDDELE